ncbi:MAG: cysteine--tRNA ligase [Thermoproteota archaeon]
MLKLYNTLTNRKEKFEPLAERVVTMYNCGLTVYDYAHIGNLRAYTFADLLRRYLEYKGFEVRQVMNFTDVGHMFEDTDIGEDKMEAAARREEKDPWAIADFYIQAFLEDSEKMNFEEPMVRPRATEHIDDMISLVEEIRKQGYGYVVNGSVYFDVSTFDDYGKLSGNTIEKLEAGAGGRVEFNPDKRNQFDFALWINDPHHIMKWESPWCEKGYPGWHIECSAMAMRYLGDTIDIHTGGVDNIFPHHENEIAQSEAATGKKFVKYWLHNEHLLVEGGKMSKSRGNFYTLRDLEAKGYEVKAVRYLLISTHYRQQLNFTFEGLEAAENAVNRLKNFVYRLKGANGGGCEEKVRGLMEEAQRLFEEAMDDDLNISLGLAAIFDFVRGINKLMDEDLISEHDAEMVYQLMMDFDKVLGVIGKTEKEGELPQKAKELIRKREELRKDREWEKADEIRKKLGDMGIIIEDTPQGVKWRFRDR